MRIHLDNEQHRLARLVLAEVDAANDPVTHIEHTGLLTRGDVSRLCGISGSTLKAIAEGKRPSRSQMAALKFAALHRALNL